MRNRIILGFVTFVLAVVLSACGTNNANENKANNTDLGAETTNNEADNTANTLNAEDTTSIPREVPEGIKEAENSTFTVGDVVTINAAHEEGMQGSQGIILGAYDTIVYSVSYIPTNDGQPEENHKWIVHEELQGLDEEMLVPGAEVILEADYEEGMFGAEGEIDTAEQTIVYMVEYVLPNGIQKQKWFKESELTATE